MKIEIDVDLLLMDGFWWTNPEGQGRWATIKYERLSDVCYGCGRMGHTSQHCVADIAMSDIRPGFPRYGPWIVGTRPRSVTKRFQL